MEYLKTFNKEEKEIYDICCKDEVDYERIDFLLKNGASANALEIKKYDSGIEDEDLLLIQCWLDGLSSQYDEDGNGKKIKKCNSTTSNKVNKIKYKVLLRE